jgi:hypothetical protein
MKLVPEMDAEYNCVQFVVGFSIFPIQIVQTGSYIAFTLLANMQVNKKAKFRQKL